LNHEGSGLNHEGTKHAKKHEEVQGMNREGSGLNHEGTKHTEKHEESSGHEPRRHKASTKKIKFILGVP
jgi:hypothetical protein